MPDNVYKVIELIGTGDESWEKAAKAAVERAGVRICRLCSRSSEKARLSAGWGETAVGKRRHGCARLGVERETTVDQTLIRGLVTAFRVFVSGLSSV